jgi:hypothetical protein
MNSSEADVSWTEFPQWDQLNQFPKGRIQPKPDLTFAFPIRKGTAELAKGLEKAESVQCFSLQVLGKLRSKGIISAPTTALCQFWNSPKGTRLSTAEYTCFPWAIVEIDNEIGLDSHSAERCYCKAANAAAAALTLQVHLIENSLGRPETNVPPVVVFTCIGPVVEVWLAYHVLDKAGHQLQVSKLHLGATSNLYFTADGVYLEDVSPIDMGSHRPPYYSYEHVYLGIAGSQAQDLILHL